MAFHDIYLQNHIASHQQPFSGPKSKSISHSASLSATATVETLLCDQSKSVPGSICTFHIHRNSRGRLLPNNQYPCECTVYVFCRRDSTNSLHLPASDLQEENQFPFLCSFFVFLPLIERDNIGYYSIDIIVRQANFPRRHLERRFGPVRVRFCAVLPFMD